VIPRPYRPYLRLMVVGLALVPVAILARATYSNHLIEFVQRWGARAWARWDKSRGGG
jgi:hypothetical protein